MQQGDKGGGVFAKASLPKGLDRFYSKRGCFQERFIIRRRGRLKAVEKGSFPENIRERAAIRNKGAHATYE